MDPETLEAGYEWTYRRFFTPQSIWARRPEDSSAVAPYLAMTYLYKHSQPLWAFLIRHRLVQAAWRPLVELNRLKHLHHRRKLEAQPKPAPGLVMLEPAS